MSKTEQETEFHRRLDKLINGFTAEFDVTYSTLIGTLQIKVMELYDDAKDQDSDD